MEVTDLHGVGPVVGRRLYGSGFRTIEDVATAEVDDLASIPGIGPATATRLKSDASTLVHAVSADATPETGRSRDRQEQIARSVRSLRKAVPHLAKSKKHQKHLKKSTARLGAWVDDLGKRKVRKRFIAEVSKISDQARKRTGSKKDARSLRSHADAIERAVRKVS